MIEILDFGQLVKPPTTRILLCQPFLSDKLWITNSKDLYYYKNSSDLESHLNVIVQKAIELEVDMIIFPELSIPKEYIAFLSSISHERGVSIIAGSQYYEEEKNISKSPIIIDGKIFYTQKITSSPFEVSPFENKGVKNGDKILVFRNTSIGDFCVIICTDYLSRHIRNTILEYEIDFLIVIAFQSNSRLYHSRMNNNCEEEESGIYMVYANVFSGTKGDGQSCIFGHLDRIFHQKIVSAGYSNELLPKRIFTLKSSETMSYVIVDFDLNNKKPSFARFINTKPNVRIVDCYPKDK